MKRPGSATKPRRVWPAERSLRECRKRAWPAGKVEMWVPRALRRRDLFGFADILALDASPGVLAIQACRTDDQAAHVDKVLQAPHARTWLARGNRIEVWGWAQRGEAGRRKRWTLSATTVTVDRVPTPTVGRT